MVGSMNISLWCRKVPHISLQWLLSVRPYQACLKLLCKAFLETKRTPSRPAPTDLRRPFRVSGIPEGTAKKHHSWFVLPAKNSALACLTLMSLTMILQT
jgi:hypothetical protein